MNEIQLSVTFYTRQQATTFFPDNIVPF